MGGRDDMSPCALDGRPLFELPPGRGGSRSLAPQAAADWMVWFAYAGEPFPRALADAFGYDLEAMSDADAWLGLALYLDGLVELPRSSWGAPLALGDVVALRGGGKGRVAALTVTADGEGDSCAVEAGGEATDCGVDDAVAAREADGLAFVYERSATGGCTAAPRRPASSPYGG